MKAREKPPLLAPPFQATEKKDGDGGGVGGARWPEQR